MWKKMQELGIDVKRERKVAEENRREFYHRVRRGGGDETSGGSGR
jgi:hypothetical protein